MQSLKEFKQKLEVLDTDEDLMIVLICLVEYYAESLEGIKGDYARALIDKLDNWELDHE